MNAVRQAWLVTVRELRERSRSRAFLVSICLTVMVVAASIILPAAVGSGGGTKDVGLTGTVPNTLSTAIEAQGKAVGTTAKIHRYGDVGAGERAVRDGEVDVLVVNGTRLEWRGRADEQLRAVVTGAIQIVAVQERATAAGIAPGDLAAVLRPVDVSSVELGSAPGRSPDDEGAATIMTVVLLLAISTYGGMVLSGVVQEKSSRVVEVLLARMPARSLLAGKIAGIGLLGLAQITLTAAVALVAVMTVPNVDAPTVRASVMAWLVVWFVLGYMLYATTFGALGSLASRQEDADAVGAPAIAVLLAAYFASLAAVGQPDGGAAQALSLVPVTAPLAMPARIAMGATAWWEPVLGTVLTLAAIAGLVWVGGRVYVNAVLRTGPTLRLREAWRGSVGAGATVPVAAAPLGGSPPRRRAWFTGFGGRRHGASSASRAMPLYEWVGRGALLGGALGFVLGQGVGIAVGLGAGALCGAAAGEVQRIRAGHGGHPAH